MRSSQVISCLLAAASLCAAAPLLQPLEDPTFIPTAALTTPGTVVQSLPLASTPATTISFINNSRGPSRPVTTVTAFQSLPATSIPVTESTIVRSVPSAAPGFNSLPSFAPSQPPATFVTSLAPPNVATMPGLSANPVTFTSVAPTQVPSSTQAHSGMPNAVSTAAY